MINSQLSPELFVAPFEYGVKLFKPESLKYIKNKTHLNKMHQIYDLLNLPVNVYFLNSNSELQICNEQNTETCGYNSLKDAIGTNIRVVAQGDTGENLIQNDHNVLKNKTFKIIEENHTKTIDGLIAKGLSFKVPYYNHEDKVIGIFGMTARLEAHAAVKLDHALSSIIKTNLFPLNNHTHPILKQSNCPSIFTEIFSNTSFSPQESKCLYYLIKGRSVKAIAQQLALSPRTVENYLTNMKFKAGVSTTADLIEMTVDAMLNR